MIKPALLLAGALFVMSGMPAYAQNSSVQYNHIPKDKNLMKNDLGGDRDLGDESRTNNHLRRQNDGDGPAARNDYVTRLDRDTITRFIGDVQRIATEGTASMAQEDIINYFNNHIADDARFDSTMKYEMPGYPAQESVMQIGKAEYINGVMNGNMMMEDYRQDIEIKDIKFSNGNRSAVVETVITETGEMPWPEEKTNSDNRPPAMTQMPVEGKSRCIQTIAISLNNFIQMKKAECYTVMSFDAFENSELGADMFFGR